MAERKVLTESTPLCIYGHMILPLDLLIEYEGNIYELTCAAIRRAYQITITGDEEIQQNQGKVVPTAIKQILTKKVVFQLEE